MNILVQKCFYTGVRKKHEERQVEKKNFEGRKIRERERGKKDKRKREIKIN